MRFLQLPKFIQVILSVFFVLSLAAPLPFVIITPGSAQNIFEKTITIKNQKSYPATGRLDLLSIRVTNPVNWITGPAVIEAWLRRDKAVYPRVAIYPPGTTNESEKKASSVQMKTSQSKAIGAAFEFLKANPDLDVGSEQLIEKNIFFDAKRTGGPSGGMIFAIGVIELLTPGDILRTRHIAGTGSISIDGRVGAIGGINEKILAAHRAGAKMFLAPKANSHEITAFPTGMRIVIIATLSDAIRALREEDLASA